MKKLIIALPTLIFLLALSSCTSSIQTPVPTTNNVLLTLDTRTTMAGVNVHLEIWPDGAIEYVYESGLMVPTTNNPATKITRNGHLTKDDLNNLLKMVDSCPFDDKGICNADTKIISTDADSVLNVYYSGLTRSITANYQPLFHLFQPPELTDVPEPIRNLFRQLKYLIDNNTTQTAMETIPVK